MEKPSNIIILGDRLVRKDYKKKANYRDSFEDLYLKHDYMNRVKPYETPISSYEHIVKTTANIMYEKNRLNFNKVGFYLDDIVNITRTYLHSFLGLYSFETDPVSFEKFKKDFEAKKGRLPTEEEINKKQRNNLINFLRQKINTCSVFCERKSRNIVANKSEVTYFAQTKSSVKANLNMISEDPEYFGYRRVSSIELREIKANNPKNDLRDKNGFKIVAISSFTDIPISLFDEYYCNGEEETSLINHSIVNPSVEENIIDYENEAIFCRNEKKFHEMSIEEKKQLLENFIVKNMKLAEYREEVKIAKKILDGLEAVV